MYQTEKINKKKDIDSFKMVFLSCMSRIFKINQTSKGKFNQLIRTYVLLQYFLARLMCSVTQSHRMLYWSHCRNKVAEVSFLSFFKWIWNQYLLLLQYAKSEKGDYNGVAVKEEYFITNCIIILTNPSNIKYCYSTLLIRWVSMYLKLHFYSS